MATCFRGCSPTRVASTSDVFDPGVWVSQVQGPKSFDVLAAAVDGDQPAPFNYFDMAEVQIAGQPVVLTRSGFTNELGWEFYLAARYRHRSRRRTHSRGRQAVRHDANLGGCVSHASH